MPRLTGVNIPDQKQILYSLTYIYGVGISSAKKILKQAKVKQDKKAKNLTEKELNALKKALGDYKVEGDLKRSLVSDIKRLKEIKCWRGMRHSKGLPVRGQKTRKNSRTIRGNVRKTVASGRKAPPAPK